MTSPRPSLIAVAWPVAVMGWLRTGYLLTDSWFVGRLGDDALAAIGGAAFAWWIVLLVADIAGVGVHALVSQHVGAVRPDLVRATFGQGLWLGLALGVGLLAFVPAVPLYLDALGFAPGAAPTDLARAFLATSLVGAVPIVLNVVVGGVFRGLGDTRVALGITVLTFALNAALLPVAVPWFGIAGAAGATVVASALGAVVGLAVLTARGLGPTVGPPAPDAILHIARIGGPVSASGIAFSCVYVLLGRFIVTFGDEQIAGLGLGHRLEGLAYQVCVAFEVGAATLVGQHIGARDRLGARRAARQAAVTCAAIMVPAGLVLFLAAPSLFAAFASTDATVAAGSAYLRTQSLVFVFMALECVYGGAFAGSGRTVVPFWIVTLGTLVRLPLAWILAWPLGFGVEGIWIAIALSTFLKGVASAWAWEGRR